MQIFATLTILLGPIDTRLYIEHKNHVVKWFKNAEILSRKTKIQRTEVQAGEAGAGICKDFYNP